LIWGGPVRLVEGRNAGPAVIRKGWGRVARIRWQVGDGRGEREREVRGVDRVRTREGMVDEG
jgi:hypothetical protein